MSFLRNRHAPGPVLLKFLVKFIVRKAFECTITIIPTFVNCMDIAFQHSTCDHVTSISPTLILLCSLFLAYPNPIDVGILIGAEGPHRNALFGLQIDFLKKLFTNVEISTKTILPGIIKYGGKPFIQNRLGSIISNEGLMQTLNNTYIQFGETYDVKETFRKVLNEFFLDDTKDRRDPAAKILLFFTTKPIENPEVELKLRQSGIKVVVIGMGAEVDGADLVPLTGTNDLIFIGVNKIDLFGQVEPVEKEVSTPGKIIETNMSILGDKNVIISLRFLFFFKLMSTCFTVQKR